MTNLKAKFSTLENAEVLRIRKGEEILNLTFLDHDNSNIETSNDLNKGWDIDFHKIPCCTPKEGDAPERALVVEPSEGSENTNSIKIWREVLDTSQGHIKIEVETLMVFIQSLRIEKNWWEDKVECLSQNTHLRVGTSNFRMED